MKRIFTTIQKEASKILLLIILAGATASCDSVLDFEEGDCSIEYQVKFKYDYNMKEVDAFAKEVKSVTLYAFDDDGNFVYQKTEQGERLADGNYAMTVDIEPGEYHLVTWAGLDNQSFAVPLLTEGVSKLEELKVLTRRNIDTRAEGEEGEYIVQHQLASLFHGEVKKQTFTRARQNTVTTIDLTKNTNNIRIVIAQVNSNPSKPVTRAINKDRFSYALYDDNGYMNYDNTLLEDNLLTYLPFVTETTSVKTRALSTNNTEAEYPAAVAEISVARLMETQKPRLEIKDAETGKELLPSGSLIEYLNLLKTQNKIDMPLQEYLDREDNYSMIFFVNENLTLLKTVMQINKWVVNIDKFDF
ncbi:FimB/Mfa2 family fimbrial subunit [Bacteroides sp.]